MTRIEHLLWILAEECAEVAQWASKAARFGLGEIQPGQPDTNAEMICIELDDLIGVLEILRKDTAGRIGTGKEERIQRKKAKIEKFLLYSKECGTLTE